MDDVEKHNKLIDYQRDLFETCADMEIDFPGDERIEEISRRIGTAIEALTEIIEMEPTK